MNKEKYEFPKNGNVRTKQSAQYLSIGLSKFWLWVKQVYSHDNIDKLLRVILMIVKLFNDD